MLTGVVHAGLAPALAAGDMRPNLILGVVVAVTALFGLEVGTTWAFVGGLTANLLTTDPLGTIPLGLLLAVAVVASVRRMAGERAIVAVLAGGLLGSLGLDLVAASGLYLTDAQAAGPRVDWLLSAWLVSAAVNAVLALVLWGVIRGLVARFAPEPIVG